MRLVQLTSEKKIHLATMQMILNSQGDLIENTLTLAETGQHSRLEVYAL